MRQQITQHLPIIPVEHLEEMGRVCDFLYDNQITVTGGILVNLIVSFNNRDTDNKEYIVIEKAVDVFGVSRKTIYQRLATHKVDRYKSAGRTFYNRVQLASAMAEKQPRPEFLKKIADQ